MIEENHIEKEKSAHLTGEKGKITIKPNPESTISITIPPNTTIMGSEKWDGKIRPPLIYSTSIISQVGELIKDLNQKIMRNEVDALVKVGSKVSALRFSEPVELTVPVDLPNGTPVEILFSNKTDEWNSFGMSVVRDGNVTFKTSHFSYFIVSAKIHEKTNPAKQIDEYWITREDEESSSVIINTPISPTQPPNTISINERKTQYANDIGYLELQNTNLVTRAELIGMVVRAFGIRVPTYINRSFFIDVDGSSSDAPYVKAAYEKGLVNGYGISEKLKPLRRKLWPYFIGDDVAVLQIVLRHYGFFAGEAKGIYDTNTQAAVLRYQKSLGWSGSGNVGTLTISRVNQLIYKMNKEYQDSTKRILFPGHYTNYAEALKIILEATDTDFRDNTEGNSVWYDKYVNYTLQSDIATSLPDMSTKITREKAEELIDRVVKLEAGLLNENFPEAASGEKEELENLDVTFEGDITEEEKEVILEKVQKIDGDGQSDRVENMLDEYRSQQAAISEEVAGGAQLQESYKEQVLALDAINDAIQEEFEVKIEKELTQQERELIKFIEPNYMVSIQAVAANDVDYSKQWPLEKINVPAAWSQSVGDQDVVIAILDTGIDSDHTDKPAHILKGYDFIDNDNSPQDEHGHGTFISGVIAANSNNSLGIAGVCQNCSIMPIRVMDKDGLGTYKDLVKGIKYAVDNGADIINMSLGSYRYSQSLLDAVNYAHQKGALLIAPSGNGGGNSLMYPAKYPNVIGVGATDSSDAIWPGSNFGDSLDISAPGANVYSLGLKSSYKYQSGTSIAAAHVAGVAGLLLSQNPALSNNEIAQAIYQNAVDLGEVGRDKYYGNGRLNASLLEVGDAVIHDVAIMDMQITPESFKTGEKTEIVASVQNQGTENENSLIIKFFVNDTQVGPSQRIADLASQEAKTVRVGWQPEINSELGDSVIKVEVVKVKGEEELDDNVMTKSLNLMSEDGIIKIQYAKNVHQYLTEEALKFLKTKNPEAYKEMNQYIQDLRKGAYDEDISILDCPSGDCVLDKNMRYLHHFYRPLDGKGYKQEYANAYDWARGGVASNNYDFEDAIEAYKQGDSADAYYKLGFVLHLIEDMSVPEHTHLEYHSDVYGGGEWGAGYEQYISDQYGSNESDCNSNGLRSFLHPNCIDNTYNDPFYSVQQKPVFSYYDSILRDYDDLKEFFDSMANLSYYRNRFQGNLDIVDGASGKLTDMFDIRLSPVKLKLKMPTPDWPLPIGPGVDLYPWKMENVGEWNGIMPLAGVDRWWETSKHEGNPDESGWYYIENSYGALFGGDVKPNRYKADWYGYALNQMERYGKGFQEPYNGGYAMDGYAYANDKILAEVFAEDLVPLAVQHAAGVMDLFWRKTHPYSVDLDFSVDGKDLEYVNAYDYGSVSVGDEKIATFVIKNNGTHYVTLGASFLEIEGLNADQFEIVRTHKNGQFFPGEETEFTVKFRPTSNWSKNATITIKYNTRERIEERVISLRGGAASDINPENIGPEITINAPTTTASSTITDTKIRVKDNWAVYADKVKVSGESTARYSDFSCVQSQEAQVDCNIKITSSGTLAIEATDSTRNWVLYKGPTYKIAPRVVETPIIEPISEPEKPVNGATYTVTMRCDLLSAIEAGQYYEIEDQITPENIKSSFDCKEGGQVEVRLFSFDRGADQESGSGGFLLRKSWIIDEMKKNGYRPANLLELLAFGADGPRQPAYYTVFSLEPVNLKTLYSTMLVTMKIFNDLSTKPRRLFWSSYTPIDTYGTFAGGADQLFAAVRIVGDSPVENESEPETQIRPLFDIIGHKYETAIRYLADKKIIGGYADGSFRPSNSVNRAEFIKIVVGAKLGYEPSGSASNCFTDVKASDWFAPYVCYAKNNGIIGGYSDGSFKPGNTINLAEAAKIVVNALGLDLSNDDSGYWYSVFIRTLQNSNFIPDSFNSVQDVVNRGQMAELIYRIMENITNKPSKVFPAESLSDTILEPVRVLEPVSAQPLDGDVYRVTMLCDLQEAIAAGKYDWMRIGAAELKQYEDASETEKCEDGKVVEMRIVDMKSTMSIQAATNEMQNAGYRLANLYELLSLGVEYLEVQHDDFHALALGSTWLDSGLERAPSISGHDLKRGIHSAYIRGDGDIHSVIVRITNNDNPVISTQDESKDIVISTANEEINEYSNSNTISLKHSLSSNSVTWSWEGAAVDEGSRYELWSGEKILTTTDKKSFTIPLTECNQYQIVKLKVVFPDGSKSDFSDTSEFYAGSTGNNTITGKDAVELMLQCLDDKEIGTYEEFKANNSGFIATANLNFENAGAYLAKIIGGEVGDKADYSMGYYGLLYYIMEFITEDEYEAYAVDDTAINESIIHKLIAKINHEKDFSTTYDDAFNELANRILGSPTF